MDVNVAISQGFNHVGIDVHADDFSSVSGQSDAVGSPIYPSPRTQIF